MRLLIFSTDKDLSVSSLYTAARVRGLDPYIIYYSDLFIQNGKLLNHTTQEPVLVDSSDKILIRWPWDAENTEVEYGIFVEKLLTDFLGQIVLDRECLKLFSPYYEDKLFQSFMFQKVGVPTPHTSYFQNKKECLEHMNTFPVVIKKRISSRSKNNFLLANAQELVGVIQHIKLENYIFQDYFSASHDLRILILCGEIVGVVDRKMHVRAKGRLAVKGMHQVESVSNTVLDQALEIAASLKADFLGIDVLIDEKRRHSFIEANLSPQFSSFEKTTSINVAERVINKVLEG